MSSDSDAFDIWLRGYGDSAPFGVLYDPIQGESGEVGIDIAGVVPLRESNASAQSFELEDVGVNETGPRPNGGDPLNNEDIANGVVYRRDYLTVRHATLGMMDYGYVIVHDHLVESGNIVTVKTTLEEAIYLTEQFIKHDRREPLWDEGEEYRT